MTLETINLYEEFNKIDTDEINDLFWKDGEFELDSPTENEEAIIDHDESILRHDSKG